MLLAQIYLRTRRGAVWTALVRQRSVGSPGDSKKALHRSTGGVLRQRQPPQAKRWNDRGQGPSIFMTVEYIAASVRADQAIALNGRIVALPYNF
jgi:hypothetical protein